MKAYPALPPPKILLHNMPGPSTFRPSATSTGYLLPLPPPFSREPGRPLFVSMLLYLNEVWADDMHAETLLLDPGAQVGVFVRPAAGRVLLMVRLELCVQIYGSKLGIIGNVQLMGWLVTPPDL